MLEVCQVAHLGPSSTPTIMISLSRFESTAIGNGDVSDGPENLSSKGLAALSMRILLDGLSVDMVMVKRAQALTPHGSTYIRLLYIYVIMPLFHKRYCISMISHARTSLRRHIVKLTLDTSQNMHCSVLWIPWKGAWMRPCQGPVITQKTHNQRSSESKLDRSAIISFKNVQEWPTTEKVLSIAVPKLSGVLYYVTRAQSFKNMTRKLPQQRLDTVIFKLLPWLPGSWTWYQPRVKPVSLRPNVIHYKLDMKFIGVHNLTAVYHFYFSWAGY